MSKEPLLLKFQDKTYSTYGDDELFYVATGLVLEDKMQDGFPNDNGQDYLVAFLDPLGFYHCQYRSADSCEVSPISQKLFNEIDYRYETLLG